MAHREITLPTQPHSPHPDAATDPGAAPPVKWPRIKAPPRRRPTPAAVREPTTPLPAGGWIPTDPPPV